MQQPTAVNAAAQQRLTTDLLLASRAVYLLFSPERLSCNTGPAILVIITKDRHYRIARISTKEYTVQMALHKIDSESGQIYTFEKSEDEEELYTTDLNGIIQYILHKAKRPFHKILLSTGLIDSDQFHKYSEFACIYYCTDSYCREGCNKDLIDKENESAGRKEFFNSSQNERQEMK